MKVNYFIATLYGNHTYFYQFKSWRNTERNIPPTVKVAINVTLLFIFGDNQDN